MDHLKEAHYWLKAAHGSKEVPVRQARAQLATAHALVALVEKLQNHSSDAETPQIIDKAIMEQLRK